MTDNALSNQMNTYLPTSDTRDYQIAVQYARDYLQGCYSDYVFFLRGSQTEEKVTQYEYIILVGNLDAAPSVYTVSSPDVLQLYITCDKSGVDPVYTMRAVRSAPGYDIQLYNGAGQIFYSSAAGDPHLIEGVSLYAFAILCAVVVYGVLVGMYRIFRHAL